MVREPMNVRGSFRIALHLVQDVHDMRTSSTGSTRYRYIVRIVPGTRYMLHIGYDTTYPVRIVLEASSWDVWYKTLGIYLWVF